MSSNSRVSPLLWPLRTGLSATATRLLLGVTCFLVCLLGPWSITLAQPKLSATLVPEVPRASEPFSLEVEVRFQGAPDRFVLYPPKVKLPEGLVQGALRQRFEQVGPETVYTYQYVLTATTPGPLSLGPITLEYRELGAVSTGGSAPPAPLELEPLSVVVAAGGLQRILGMSLLVLLLGSMTAGFLFWRRRKQRPPPARLEPPSETPASLLEKARGHLLRGEADQVFATLLALKPMLNPTDDPLPSAEQLEAERLRVRYGGAAVSRETLERLLRQVELLVRPSRNENCNGDEPSPR